MGSEYCYIGDFGIIPGLRKTGCIGKIIALYKTPNDQETSYIHEYLMKKREITNTIVLYRSLKVCGRRIKHPAV